MRPPFASTLTLLACCCWTTGCNTPSSGQANTQPAEAPGRVFRMADAVPLEKIEGVEQDTQMVYRVNPPQTPIALYFGEVHSRDDDSVLGAMIAMRSGGRWRAVQLDNPALEDFGWEFVGGGPHKNEVWGVLDSMDEDPAPDLALIHSTDGGATFIVSTVRKPAYYATFNDFAMARDGHGRLTVFLEADYSPKVKTGYYNYRTLDGGKTWSHPDFEPDGLIPADQVPDDEQPKTSHGATRAAADEAPVINAALRR